jgi:azurin
MSVFQTHPVELSAMKRSFLLLALLASGSAAADECTIALKGDDAMKFDQASITVSAACPEITIDLTHIGKLARNVMGHNVVISPTADYLAAAQAGAAAGLEGNYVPAGDARVIAFTPVVGGGETATVKFPGSKLRAGTAYTFYCSFPGHWAIMKGDLVVK